MAEFDRKRRERKGIAAALTEIASAFRAMPKTMKQLAVVQFFTWSASFACGCFSA